MHTTQSQSHSPEVTFHSTGQARPRACRGYELHFYRRILPSHSIWSPPQPLRSRISPCAFSLHCGLGEGDIQHCASSSTGQKIRGTVRFPLLPSRLNLIKVPVPFESILQGNKALWSWVLLPWSLKIKAYIPPAEPASRAKKTPLVVASISVSVKS